MAGFKRLEAWELFVARLKEEDAGEVAITATKPQPSSNTYVATAGATTREGGQGKVVAVEVPTAETAQGRTIRLHESLHARITPLPFAFDTPNWVKQAVEDAHLHTTEWPQGAALSVERDAAVSALREVRAITRTLASLPSEVREALPREVRQAALSCLTRDLAMLETAEQRLGPLPGEWRENLEGVVPEEVLEGAATAARLTRAGRWQEACALLQAALEPASRKPKGNAEGEGAAREGPSKDGEGRPLGGAPEAPPPSSKHRPAPSPAPAPKPEPPPVPKPPPPPPRNREREEEEERERQKEFQRALTHSVKRAPQLLETLVKVAPCMVELVPHGLQPLALSRDRPNVMEIVELEPRVEPVKLGRGRRLMRAASGLHVRVAGIAQAYASGNAFGLFKRKRFTQSVAGSILIDASGSMGLTAARLEELVRSAPGAIIAYYAGIDDCGGGGSLYVAARNGKLFRTKPGEKLPRCGGGNDVDEKALLWLLRQKAPRVLVTDLHFCGGDAGQAQRAHALFRAALKARKLLHFGSLPAALEGFAKMVREAALRR